MLRSLVAASALASAWTYKVGFIADLHMNVLYEPTSSVDNNCWGSNSYMTNPFEVEEQVAAEEYAAYGRMGCDPPQKLVSFMLDQMKSEHPDVDFVIVSGDHVGHGLSADESRAGNYELL